MHACRTENSRISTSFLYCTRTHTTFAVCKFSFDGNAARLVHFLSPFFSSANRRQYNVARRAWQKIKRIIKEEKLQRAVVMQQFPRRQTDRQLAFHARLQKQQGDQRKRGDDELEGSRSDLTDGSQSSRHCTCYECVHPKVPRVCVCICTLRTRTDMRIACVFRV